MTVFASFFSTHEYLQSHFSNFLLHLAYGSFFEQLAFVVIGAQ